MRKRVEPAHRLSRKRLNYTPPVAHPEGPGLFYCRRDLGNIGGGRDKVDVVGALFRQFHKKRGQGGDIHLPAVVLLADPVVLAEAAF